MLSKIITKYGWLIGLLLFDFLYFYFILHITTPKLNGLWVPIPLDGLIFVVLISGLSLGCVWWVKKQLERKRDRSISNKYLQLFFYSIGLFALLTSGTQFLIEYLMGQQRNLEYVISNGLAFLFLHVIVGNAYIAIAYVRESTTFEQELLRSEKAKAESELKVLQQQMSPHFLFNNLNTLTSLIPPEGEQAIAFTRHLSLVFRYVSQNARKDLVSLREELDFLDHYLRLLQFRFGNAYSLDKQLGTLDADEYLAVPLALQVIFENVVKHNSGSRADPLRVELITTESHLLIRNQVRSKPLSPDATSGIGLSNLRERYHLTTGRELDFGREGETFYVRLPLIKTIRDAHPGH